MRRKIIRTVLGAWALVAAMSVCATPQVPSTPPGHHAGMMYGYQLMTPAERSTYWNHMRQLKTPQERQAFRLEHHREMQKRAAARGITLPDMPMGRGQGMGPGRNMGPGRGMGHRMGPGMMPSSPASTSPPPAAGTSSGEGN